MGPSAMRNDATIRYSEHVRIFEAVLATKLSEIPYRRRELPVRIDKSFVRLDVIATAHTIRVGPSPIGLEFAAAHCEAMHGSVVQSVAPAKIRQPDDYDGTA